MGQPGETESNRAFETLLVDASATSKIREIAQARGIRYEDFIGLMLMVAVSDPDWLIAAGRHILESGSGQEKT